MENQNNTPFNPSFWHTFKRIIREIFVIVFSILVSVWITNWNEHRREQQQVKAFLLGLKTDIHEDIHETKQILTRYKEYDTVYAYLYSLDKNKVPNKDSLAMFLPQIRSNITLRPNSNRFTSFQTSGKLTNIDNDSLLLEIVDLYQEYIPRLKSSEGGWVSINGSLQNYIMDTAKEDNDMAYWQVLTTPKGKYLCKSLIPWKQLYQRYEDFIEQGEKIIKRIDELYPSK